MENTKLNRINELARLARERELTAEEYVMFSGTHCDHMVIPEPYNTKFFEGLKNAVLKHGDKVIFNDTYVLYLTKKPL